MYRTGLSRTMSARCGRVRVHRQAERGDDPCKWDGVVWNEVSGSAGMRVTGRADGTPMFVPANGALRTERHGSSSTRCFGGSRRGPRSAASVDVAPGRRCREGLRLDSPEQKPLANTPFIPVAISNFEIHAHSLVDRSRLFSTGRQVLVPNSDGGVQADPSFERGLPTGDVDTIAGGDRATAWVRTLDEHYMDHGRTSYFVGRSWQRKLFLALCRRYGLTHIASPPALERVVADVQVITAHPAMSPRAVLSIRPLLDPCSNSRRRCCGVPKNFDPMSVLDLRSSACADYVLSLRFCRMSCQQHDSW